MKAGRIIALVVGSIVALIGSALLIGTGALAWAYTTQRDDDGYFTSNRVRIETVTAAMHSQSIDLGSDERPNTWPFRKGDLAEVRIRLTAREGEEVFIGIAHTVDVDSYLSGVAHDEVSKVRWSSDRVDYRRSDGETTAAPPTEQDFWVAQVHGPGEQTLMWEVEGGHWSVVVMNPDGSASVAADVTVGVKIPALVGLMIGMGVASLLLLGGAAALIVFGTRRSKAAEALGPSTVVVSYGTTSSPVRLTATLDEPLSRGLWLVKWFLAIPHFIVLAFLWIAYVVTTFIAGVSILFTRRYPKSIFDFNVGVLRWTWRVTYYATSGIGTDRYPPFSLSATDYPATLDIERQETLNRWLVLIKWWLLAIPHYIVIGFFMGGGWFDFNGTEAGGFGLIGVCSVFAGVALLFSGRYPRGLFDFVMGMNRWVYRVVAYASLMTDQYPPFSFDAGSEEVERDITT